MAAAIRLNEQHSCSFHSSGGIGTATSRRAVVARLVCGGGDARPADGPNACRIGIASSPVAENAHTEHIQETKISGRSRHCVDRNEGLSSFRANQDRKSVV